MSVTVTDIVKVSPVPTRFLLSVTALITGVFVSRVTVRLTVVLLLALSVEIISIVFTPSLSVRVVLNAPLLPTSTFYFVPPLRATVTVQGLDVLSLVVPATVTGMVFVTKLFAGLVILS